MKAKAKTKAPKKPRPLLSPLTVRRLRLVRSFILRRPKVYNQGSMQTPGRADLNCGSQGCIFGLALALFNKSRGRGRLMAWKDGAKALGFRLTAMDKQADGLSCYNYSSAGCAAHRLFYGWPAYFRGDSIMRDIPAKDAAARILHFIATDGRE